jgi:hypothetical protein
VKRIMVALAVIVSWQLLVALGGEDYAMAIAGSSDSLPHLLLGLGFVATRLLALTAAPILLGSLALEQLLRGLCSSVFRLRRRRTRDRGQFEIGDTHAGSESTMSP